MADQMVPDDQPDYEEYVPQPLLELENSPVPLSTLHHFSNVQVPFQGQTHLVDLLASTDMVGEQKNGQGPYWASGRRPGVLIINQLARLQRGAKEFPNSDNRAVLDLFSQVVARGEKYVVVACHGSTDRGELMLEYVMQDQLYYQSIGSFLKELADGSNGKGWSAVLITACNEGGLAIPQDNIKVPTAIYDSNNSGTQPSTVKLYLPQSK